MSLINPAKKIVEHTKNGCEAHLFQFIRQFDKRWTRKNRLDGRSLLLHMRKSGQQGSLLQIYEKCGAFRPRGNFLF